MVEKRLSKALAAAGIASRRAAEELIRDGKIKVNGKIVYLPQTRIDWEQDQIIYNKRLIRGEEKKVYYMLNKPRGYICSNKQIGRKKLVIDLFRDKAERLFTIGRLDRDTTGLLLLSNDGHFANRVIHPSANISKEYLVKVAQEVSHEHLLVISQGIWIEGKKIKPIKVKKVRRGTIKVVVKEGKKREVRLLIQQAKLNLLSLHRIRIGGLKLGNLKEKDFRELTETDKEQLFR